MILFAILLMISFVSAHYMNDGHIGYEKRVEEGIYEVRNGGQLEVKVGEDHRTTLKIKGIEAYSDLEIISDFFLDKLLLKSKLPSGRNIRINVMPNNASNRALQEIGLKNCTENCEIELKLVGKENQMRFVYEVRVEKHSKFLGLFQAKMKVQVQVDAESGEIVRVGKSWWSFLAVESEE